MTVRLLPALAIALLGAAAKVQSATVTVDAGVSFQRMEGFGTSSRVFDDPHIYENFNPATSRSATILTTAQQNEVLDRLYVELGLTRVHPVNPDVGTLEGQPYIGVEPVNDNADPYVTDLSKFDFSWKNLDAHVTEIDRARQRGVTTYFLSPLNRQTWMGASTANDAAEYAEWLLAMVLRAQALGVTLPYLSVANEPSYNRNMMSGAFIRDVIKNLGPRLRAAGLPTLFVTPDDVRSSDAAAKTMTIMADPVARSYVGALATHLYDEPLTNVGQMKALAQQYGLPLWMTETSMGLAGSFGFGNGPFDWADLIHQLISTYDVTALDYQWGFIGTAGNGSLIDLNSDPATNAYAGYTLRKEYYVTGQYSRWVRPGARRILADSTGGNIKVTAYVDGTQVTIVALNSAASLSESVLFNLAGLPGITSLTPVRTSGTENWATLPPINVTGTSFTATLPHGSLTTFTATLPAGNSGTVSLDAGSYSVGEGAGAVTIGLIRAGGSSGAISVALTTSNGTATAGSDYTATAQTVNFADGATTGLVTIPITDDAAIEGAESFTVTLSNPQNLSGGAAPALGPPTSATVTIQDNDAAGAQGVFGTISSGASRVGNARITLFTADLAFFREVRSDVLGNYLIGSVPASSYRLGVAARGFQYQEIDVTVGGSNAAQNFALAAETHPGAWTLSGSIAPELLEGTGSGTLLPTGETLFCHDTIDPIALDPVTGVKWFPPSSLTPQGCHIMTLLTRGDTYYGGGSMSGNPQDTVTQVSEYYRRTTNTWTQLANMNLGRWYPSLVRLPDERLLLIGGEVPPNGYNRTNTCEIYNPATNTYTNTGAFNLPTEIPPALLLKNGTVFKTWRYPEFYNIATETWSAGPTMLQTRVGASNGDHCDHEIVYLPDGRVMAIGIRPVAGAVNPQMVEFYNPATNSWSLGPNVRFPRMRPETLLLPDGRVLAWGGEYTGASGAGPVLKTVGLVPDCTNTADIFDPATNSWRPVSDANRWVHYHNVQVLLPDGRVMNTGGAGTGGSFGTDSSVEYFSPPYLFRGVRPSIGSVSTTNLVPGGSVTLQVSRTSAVTQVVLLGSRASTHWVDAGVQRYLSLPFTQNGTQVAATLPNDSVEALAGWYLLMVMVDDIPSEARMVRVTPSAPAAIPSLPSVTIAAAGTPSEAGDTGTFTLTRTGAITAPFAVSVLIGGSAKAGADYAALVKTASFAAGSATATLTVSPVNDTLGEGPETVQATLDPRVHYAVGATPSATLTIADNDPSASGMLQFAPTAYTVNESGGIVTFTVTRTGGTTGAVSVSVAASGGTALAGADYSGASTTLTWPVGDATPKSCDVAIMNDTLAEGSETLFLTLSNATGGATLGVATTAIATILEPPFDDWRFARFGADANDPAIGGILADPDADGIENLIEFGLNLDPLTASNTGLPVAGSSGGQLTLAFTRNPAATDLHFTVQVSSDLLTWTNGSSYSAAASFPNTEATSDITPNGSPPNYILLRDNAPVGSTPRFIRLKVAQP